MSSAFTHKTRPINLSTELLPDPCSVSCSDFFLSSPNDGRPFFPGVADGVVAPPERVSPCRDPGSPLSFINLSLTVLLLFFRVAHVRKEHKCHWKSDFLNLFFLVGLKIQPCFYKDSKAKNHKNSSCFPTCLILCVSGSEFVFELTRAKYFTELIPNFAQQQQWKRSPGRAWLIFRRCLPWLLFWSAADFRSTPARKLQLLFFSLGAYYSCDHWVWSYGCVLELAAFLKMCKQRGKIHGYEPSLVHNR